MHYVDGFKLKFTARTSWLASVFKDGKIVAEVPVAWLDQMTWDRVAKRPTEFLVWLRTREKAEKWLSQGESLIAVAQAVDTNEDPRRFKQFTRLYRVEPLGVGEHALSVRARFVDVVTSKSFPS